MTTLWLHSDYILTIFWLNSDYILTTFWLHSDLILTTRAGGGHHELLIYCSRWSLISKDKKIYRPQMIVDDRCYIRLRWSCFKRDRISPNRADGTHKTDRTDSTDGIDRTDGIDGTDGTDGTIMILAMLLKYSLCIFLIICIYNIENVTNKAPVKMAMWSIKTISK